LPRNKKRASRQQSHSNNPPVVPERAFCFFS